MKISLIGMSGSGKTYWSKKLEKKGFKRYCCDDLIENKLHDELKKLGYTGGIKDVAQWMGQPFQDNYKQASKQYVTLENEAMREIVEDIEERFNEDIVIDTTGSLIYVSKHILKKLSESTKIIYLDLSHEAKRKMYTSYVKDPKPVIWGKAFSKKDGETNKEALKRCYPNLLEIRSKKYEQLSHITLGYHQILETHFIH